VRQLEHKAYETLPYFDPGAEVRETGRLSACSFPPNQNLKNIDFVHIMIRTIRTNRMYYLLSIYFNN
jgi:hypothetical protein